MKFTKILCAVAVIGAVCLSRAATIRDGYNGARSLNVIQLLTNVNDAETITIGSQVFETDMHPSNRITSGRTRIDLTTNGTQASGVLTFTNQPENGDAFTVNGRTYTFKTAIASEGDVKIGASKAASITNLYAALNDVAAGGAVDGTDWYATTGHSNVYGASLTTGALTVKARAPGMEGNAFAFSRAWATNIGMGSATTLSSGAGPNPATDPFLVTNIVRQINQSNRVQVTAYVIDTNQILIATVYPGGGLNCSETLAGASISAASTYGGKADVNKQAVFSTVLARIPTALEKTLGQMHFLYPFTPIAAVVDVRGTNGLAVPWAGAATITGNRITIDNSGASPWGVTNVVTVIASP